MAAVAMMAAMSAQAQEEKQESTASIGQGFVNIADSLKGVQLSPVSNIAESLSGLQLAGFSNVAYDGMKGVQLSALNNIVIGEANGLQLGENYKIIAGLGGLPSTKNADGTARTPDYTKEAQYAVKTVKLLAQATGDFTRDELNGDATFRWTKAAKQTIDAIVNPTPTPETPGGGD